MADFLCLGCLFCDFCMENCGLLRPFQNKPIEVKNDTKLHNKIGAEKQKDDY